MADKLPEKKYYNIVVEALVPTTLTYRVYAENEEEALKLINKQLPTNVKPRVIQKKPLKATVYELGSLIVKLIKNYPR